MRLLVLPTGTRYHRYDETDAGQPIPACAVRFGGHELPKEQIGAYKPCRRCWPDGEEDSLVIEIKRGWRLGDR